MPVPALGLFDRPVTRSTMASFFYHALPEDAFDAPVSNNMDFMPQHTENKTTQALFKAGVMIGDERGFRLDDTITRAEAAAIIYRVANPGARVIVSAPVGSGAGTQQQPTVVITPGEVQTDKPYRRIPNTNWQSDPTGGVTVQSQAGWRINTKYGNHTYGCANQEEYNKALSVMDEAFNYAAQKEAEKTRRGGLDSLAKEGTSRTVFYQQQLGITDKQQIISMRVTESFVYEMQLYLFNTYAKPNGAGTNPDAGNNNVYKYLFGGGKLDCDGCGNFNMLCYDYLGFSTRMITSYNAVHAASQVYVNGRWVMLNQESGSMGDLCTHSQLMELISGVKNDVYKAANINYDYFITQAKANIDGSADYVDMSDLHIESNETPTHAPDDFSIK